MSELTFEQMLEESLKTIHNGEVVEGTVIDVKPDEIILNIGYKADGIISRSEYTNEPNADLTTMVSVGDTMTAKVLKVNDGEGQVLLTYKRLAAEKGNERLKEAFENKEVLKAIMYRIIGIIIPGIIFTIYLICTNSLMDFIDYCVFGIGTFTNNVSYMKLLQGKDLEAFLGLVTPITFLILFIEIIINIKNKKIKENKNKLILFVFALAQFTVVYPIADEIHFKIAVFPIFLVMLYYIFKEIQEIKNIKISIFIEHFMNIITISLVGMLILSGINDIFIYTQTEKSVLKHFSNIPISNTLQERILEVNKYIEDEERDVYILDSEAAVYMIPLDKYNKDFDMFLRGNLGAKGEEGQIEKIKEMNNTVLLIKNEKIPLNWQTPKEVIEYVKNNLEKIGTINFFDIYISE